MNESCSHIGIPYPQSDLPHIFSFSGYTISDIECSIIMYTYDQLSPEDNHTRMKKNNLQQNLQQQNLPRKKAVSFLISQMVFFFFLASIGGFLWEVLIFLFQDGIFRNRGFLYGPWLPVYGAGAVFCLEIPCSASCMPNPSKNITRLLFFYFPC